MAYHNPNCDGDKCKPYAQEVRVYPLGGGANLMLCMPCWANENKEGLRYNWYEAEVKK